MQQSEEREREVRGMQLTITAEPKEIAELVVAIQDRRLCDNLVDEIETEIINSLSRSASFHTL